jgi:hypothetical protein
MGSMSLRSRLFHTVRWAALSPGFGCRPRLRNLSLAANGFNAHAGFNDLTALSRWQGADGVEVEFADLRDLLDQLGDPQEGFFAGQKGILPRDLLLAVPLPYQYALLPFDGLSTACPEQSHMRGKMRGPCLPPRNEHQKPKKNYVLIVIIY